MEGKRMNEASDNNLDWHAAKSAQTIVKNTRTIKVKKNGKEESIEASSLDNLTTKTLGILQENGVYAALLYLYSRGDKEQFIAKQIRKQLLRLTLLLLPSLEKDEKEKADEIVAE